ncbi:MAG: hypothetical protein ACOVOW_09220 [Spirosomataceae bacterium]
MKQIVQFIFEKKSYFFVLVIFVQGWQLASIKARLNSFNYDVEYLRSDVDIIRNMVQSVSSNSHNSSLRSDIETLKNTLTNLENQVKAMQEKELLKNAKPLKPRTFDLHDKSWK